MVGKRMKISDQLFCIRNTDGAIFFFFFFLLNFNFCLWQKCSICSCQFSWKRILNNFGFKIIFNVWNMGNWKFSSLKLNKGIFFQTHRILFNLFLHFLLIVMTFSKSLNEFVISVSSYSVSDYYYFIFGIEGWIVI